MKKQLGPSQKWEDFLEQSIPKHRGPSAADLFSRWGTMTDGQPDPRHPNRTPAQVPAGDGEVNAYRAWLDGAMEPEEEKFFRCVVLRPDVLTLLAIVPMLQRHDAFLQELVRNVGANNRTALGKIADVTTKADDLELRILALEETVATITGGTEQ